MLRTITIEIIAHSAQRYDTLGDWLFERLVGSEDDKLLIRISDTGDFRMTACLALHELVEALLCRWEGVTAQMVDQWDIHGPGKRLDEPGADPRAPYHRQHYRAEVMERIFAEMLCLRWHQYEQLLEEFSQEEKHAKDGRGGVGSEHEPTVDK